jgi:NAD(P)-dependent dehydrogenase (short-subunit alcohol dehydrogenase family)
LIEEGVKPEPDKQGCLVTGASRGIGEAIARCFCAAGTRLVLLDVNSEGAEHMTLDINGGILIR